MSKSFNNKLLAIEGSTIYGGKGLKKKYISFIKYENTFSTLHQNNSVSHFYTPETFISVLPFFVDKINVYKLKLAKHIHDFLAIFFAYHLFNSLLTFIYS